MNHYVTFWRWRIRKESGIKKSCGSWSDKVVVILPLTEFLTSKLQKILLIRVLWFLCILIACSIFGWSNDDAYVINKLIDMFWDIKA